jgi:MFS family permease
MSTRTGLWAHADFLRLWSAQAISAFGSRITRTALPIIAVQTLHESETIVALLSSVYLAPGVLLALFAGGIVDRNRKRRILIAADIFRAATVASITIAWLLGALTMWHLVMVGALVGAASALFTIADVAYLPTLVDKRQLAEGNAKLETTEAVAEITGPASAGVLIGAFGAPLAVAIDAASYLWSAVMLGRIRAAEPPPAPAPSAQSSTWQSRRDLRDGMRAIFGHPYVRAVVLALMVWSIAGGFFTALYTLFCLRTLGLHELTFGIIIAIGGIGSFGGALISRRLVARIGLGPTLIASAAISLAGGLLIPLARGSHATVLLCLGAHQLISDCFSVAFVIQAVTLRQTVLPRHLLGRANAAVHVCTAGLVPVTAVLAGLLAELTSIRTAVWVGVSIGLVAPFCLIPLRKVKPMPEAASSTEIARATGN